MIFTESILADLYLLGILIVIFAHQLKLYYSKRWQVFDPLNMFWAGVLMVYIRQPILYENTLNQWHNSGVYEESLFWVLFGIVWVIIGYEVNQGIFLGNKIPVIAKDLIPIRLISCGWLMVLLGFAGYYYLISSAGSLDAWLSVPRGGTDWGAVSGYWASLEKFLPAGLTILLFQSYLHNAGGFKKVLIWSASLLMLYWLFYLGTRSRTILFVLSILAAYYLPRHKNPSLILVGSIFVLLIMVTNFQEHYRDNFTNLSLNLNKIDIAEAYISSAPTFLGGSKDLQEKNMAWGTEFNCVMSVIELVPQHVGYNFGYGYLEVFTRPIPRAIWPDKVYPGLESVQGVYRAARLSNSYVRDRNLLMGPAFTYIGYWYYVGGAFALVFGGIVTGVLFRTIRVYYDLNADKQGAMVLYSLLFPLGFVEAAATPLNWMFYLPQVFIPICLMLWVCRDKSKEIST